MVYATLHRFGAVLSTSSRPGPFFMVGFDFLSSLNVPLHYIYTKGPLVSHLNSTQA